MKTTLGLALLLVAGVFSVWVKSDLRREASSIDTLNIGQTMPDFTLLDADGREFNMASIAGQNKLVMINFWASWCAPCRVEMPGFEKLYSSKSKDGFLLLGINEDEDRSKADAYLMERPVSFPILLDPQGTVMKQLGVRALPTTVLVGSDGKIRHVQEGVSDYVDILVDTYMKVDAMIVPAGK